MIKYFLFDEAHYRFAIILTQFAMQDGTIWIGEGHMGYTGHQWVEPAMIMRLACGERDRSHGAPVECAEEADKVMALRVILGQFNGRLHRLRSRVGQKRFCAFLKRGDLVQ